MDNVHEGHRKRLKERFIKNGFDDFQPHEIIEFILTYTIPRRDTNVYAHDLIKKFGSFSGVLNAPINQLVEINGITENSAVLLKSIPQMLRFYHMDINDITTLDNIETVKKYFSNQYIGLNKEVFKVCCLDNNLKVVSCATISKGNNDRTDITTRLVAEEAIRTNTSNVIVSHNHPNGIPKPSDDDIMFTRILRRGLDGIGIVLFDHVIVGKNDIVLSMKDMGLMPLID